MNLSHLTDQAMKRVTPVHFTKVLDSGDIVAADDTINMAITWKKQSNDFTLWSYKTGQFVKVNAFQSESKPDRTRTAVSVAKKQLKSLKKGLMK